MIDFKTILAISKSERRLTRRLVRYWVFMILSGLIGVSGYAYYEFLHKFGSSWSATVASINPRYIVNGIGIWYMGIFLFGIVFLAFDVRARDTRERMSEVLDALPCSNLELVLGKFLGLLIPAWIPVVVIGGILTAIGAAVGNPIEPYSLFGFVVVMAIPAFAWVIGASYLITLLVRHRGIAALLIAALIVGMWVLTFRTPIHSLALFDVAGAYQLDFPSDVTPGVANLGGWLQRLAVLLEAFGFLWIAAAIHPRLDDGSRVTRAATGTAMILVGVAIVVGFTIQARGWVADQERWAQTHRAASTEPSPDVVSIEGRVTIEPGSRLVERLAMEIRAPAATALDELLFSLNPGLEIERVAVDGSPAGFTHEQGLLRIDPGTSLAPGATARVELDASGYPRHWFAYLDGVINPWTTNAWNGQVFILGFWPQRFDHDFVALMSGVRWLPASGAELGRGDPAVRPRDLYTADLTVDVPAGWLVAGPAARRPVESADHDGDSFRFATTAPVPDVTLVAAPFESRSTELDGVTLEVLIHPSHVEGVDFFADAGDELATWLSERMDEASSIGLGYPYDALSLVEVPADLRGFAGGWRLDSALTQPALILMKENGFPTADFAFRFQDEEEFADREGGLARAKRDVLLTFFENDFNGGNPFIGAARSYFTHVTAAAGEEGLPLDFVLEDLSTRLVADRRGFFSAHLFNNQDINNVVGQSLQRFFTGRGRDITVADAVIEEVTSAADVWDATLGVSLERLDPWDEPKRALNVLTLKGGAMAHSMLDEFGAETSGKLLAALREGSDDRPISRETVLEAGSAAEVDLEPWLDLWIEQTSLPGFVAERAEAFRLPDTDEGTPQYQLSIVVRNDEPVPGLARLEYRAGDRRGGGRDAGQRGGNPNRGAGGASANAPRGGIERSEPFRVDGRSAVRVGILTSKPPRAVRVAPYLSLNREAFAVELPDVDEETLVEREPLSGVEPVEWSPPDSEAVLVDDLDDGFRVEGEPARSFLRAMGSSTVEQTDRGLPTVSIRQRPKRWSRAVSPRAFGRYRHTAAIARAGDGSQRAIFPAEIPRAGRWRLEIHVPRPPRRGGGGESPFGTWNLELAMQGDTEPLTFDASAAEDGWNAVGEFELPRDEVELAFTDKTDGRVIHADAIRWMPVGARQQVARRETR